MSKDKINYILSSPIEQSVAERGLSPEAVWLDRENSREKGVRRCEAIFRMISRQHPFTLLDVGCGPGFAVPFLEERYGSVEGSYLGIDVSEALVAEARRLWPAQRFEVRDILEAPLPKESFEFSALNGVLTSKYDLSHQEMENFSCALLQQAWKATNKALSFNVMSTHVDWTRPDLFHWSMDEAVAFCVSKLSRHVNVIADYGLYEYTVQVFRTPAPRGSIPEAWTKL